MELHDQTEKTHQAQKLKMFKLFCGGSLARASSDQRFVGFGFTLGLFSVSVTCSTTGRSSHRCHRFGNYDIYDANRINRSRCLNCCEYPGYDGQPGAGACLQGATPGYLDRIREEWSLRCPIREGDGSEILDVGGLVATLPARQTQADPQTIAIA